MSSVSHIGNGLRRSEYKYSDGELNRILHLSEIVDLLKKQQFVDFLKAEASLYRPQKNVQDILGKKWSQTPVGLHEMKTSFSEADKLRYLIFQKDFDSLLTVDDEGKTVLHHANEKDDDKAVAVLVSIWKVLAAVQIPDDVQFYIYTFLTHEDYNKKAMIEYAKGSKVDNHWQTFLRQAQEANNKPVNPATYSIPATKTNSRFGKTRDVFLKNKQSNLADQQQLVQKKNVQKKVYMGQYPFGLATHTGECNQRNWDFAAITNYGRLQHVKHKFRNVYFC